MTTRPAPDGRSTSDLPNTTTSDSTSNDLDEWLAATPGIDSNTDAATEAARQRIGRLSHMLAAVLDEVAAAHHLTPGDWEALSVMARSGGACTPTMIGDALALTSGTVSTRIRRLIDGGLVTRTPDGPVDRRSRPVRLTPTGWRRWRRATEDRVRLERELFGSLSSAQTDQLNELLTVALAGFESRYGRAPAHDRVG
ncbi:MarR family winged helix-turn-helix transcriptional regulator [Gordonia polyisoprenivorans]|uniref:MarR family winged helix-turn-helix transcriptional regulator n=1 Tax=Gordonia polyisoprenivorans TaxID=84595 RepID=UPI001F0A686A|nr:MarR family transcriptional regulator [Gordonia polyisoprenivorans]UZF58759.1 MarR family transcriptional regulator [Gordonia polyisoprenivorans]